MAGICSTLPYELRVGVTGHRTISDEAAVRHAIRSLVDRIDATLRRPGAEPPTWTVVSPLARGADRLVAEAILERPQARLEVITPFKLDEYRKDFDTEADRGQFEALLARAAQVNELDAGPTGEPSSTLGKAERDVAYLKVGERLIDACEILIVIWNGRRAAGIGGTADIVQHALQRERVVLWIHSERPHEPPKLVRAVKPAIDPNAQAASVETEEIPRVAKGLSRGYHQQTAYCLDGALDPAKYADDVRKEHDSLVGAAKKAGLPPDSLEPILAQLVPEFVRADRLAIGYQTKHTRAVTGVLYLAGFAVTVAVTQVLFFPDHLWLILFEVAAMVGVLGLWWYSRREGWHEKWLHDRYLAERLRTVMFMTIAGCTPAEATLDDPLPFYRGPRQWLTMAVDSLSRSASRELPAMEFDALKLFLRLAWLEDQHRFHKRNEDQKARSARLRRWLGLGLFGTTLVMALLHLFGVGHQVVADRPGLLRPDMWITWLAIIGPVWAGAVHAITSQLELERIAERSARMATVLQGVAHRLARTRTPAELRQIILESGELMKVENHEWWVLLSFQDVRLHV